MIAVSKNIYIDRLNDIVDGYNNTHRTIKMKSNDIKKITFIKYAIEHNDEDLKFKGGDHIRIAEYKSIFAKGYTPNCFEEVFVLKES